MNGTTITKADLQAIADEYGVEVEGIERAGDGWRVEYADPAIGTETYLSGEEACEALRAYGRGPR